MFNWLNKIFGQKEQIEYLEYNLKRIEQKNKSNELLIFGLECELDKNYKLAVKYYQESTNVWHNPKSDIHIAVCLAALGNILDAKIKLEEIREKDALYECEKIGKLLEEGFFGSPDYNEARKWYMTASWPTPNNENVINARKQLARIMQEHEFNDYCCECGKSLHNETIYFNSSRFDPSEEYCSSCIEIAPFIYVFNIITGRFTI